ncbi:HSPB1-associated protein 1 homolog isoform X1 [Micropterus salmoides]|uniref:HSPB1-associated protein 1 homolog isoform X1 n=1 Tax=Micropterus salmoides TaxID=27706 RepID=UPI0018EB1BF1|nr:HSPB1-associated protein 1 homolog isoform X1 [Micropterus salmoides]XP_038577007.1 HSPB1-associated protein 1 homolog isoform X1 [Micropterus salmoides]
MAAPDSSKPFSPAETQRILHHLQQPAVFLNMTCGWPVLHWTAEHLSDCLGDKLVRFRLGKKKEAHTATAYMRTLLSSPLFETQCSYVEAKLVHFLSWNRDQAGTDVGPFFKYPKSEYWAYADYKYIAILFQDQPSMFEHVKWSEFGFEGRNGRESTLWIGSEGANTPCHLDSYGYNLVLQVHGRKRWHLFPPEDTVNLYPTRIPYEESSVFSQVDVLNPDLRRFPAFQEARAHTVTLQPGQVLYVPRHWWHYVESVDPITVSVNSWIELEVDDVARVSEAVTKAVVSALKSAPSDDNTDDWLNPTEEGVASHNDNMQYVNMAVRASAQRQQGLCHSKLTQDPRDTRPVKRDSRGQIRTNSDLVRDSALFSVPFGPHLIPVCCQQEYSPETRGVTTKDLEVKSSRNCNAQTPDDCTANSDAATKTKLASAVNQGKCECSPGLTQYRPCDHADVASEKSSEDYEEPVHTTITTNDLLDCLVHPDIIDRVTKLLLERHTGGERTTMPS